MALHGSDMVVEVKYALGSLAAEDGVGCENRNSDLKRSWLLGKGRRGWNLKSSVHMEGSVDAMGSVLAVDFRLLLLKKVGRYTRQRCLCHVVSELRNQKTGMNWRQKYRVVGAAKKRYSWNAGSMNCNPIPVKA